MTWVNWGGRDSLSPSPLLVFRYTTLQWLLLMSDDTPPVLPVNLSWWYLWHVCGIVICCTMNEFQWWSLRCSHNAPDQSHWWEIKVKYHCSGYHWSAQCSSICLCLHSNWQTYLHSADGWGLVDQFLYQNLFCMLWMMTWQYIGLSMELVICAWYGWLRSMRLIGMFGNIIPCKCWHNEGKLTHAGNMAFHINDLYSAEVVVSKWDTNVMVIAQMTGSWPLTSVPWLHLHQWSICTLLLEMKPQNSTDQLTHRFPLVIDYSPSIVYQFSHGCHPQWWNTMEYLTHTSSWSAWPEVGQDNLRSVMPHESKC